MKNQKIIFALLLFGSFYFSSCSKDEDISQKKDISVPTKFKVDIPSSISRISVNKNAEGDTLQGNEIYNQLTTFIAAGEGAADIVQNIMGAISLYNLSQAMSFSFVSDDDGKSKNVIIVENSEFDNSVWQFQLSITDAESEENPDQGLGMQVFWNTNPVKGIAILSPKNINKNQKEVWSQAMFRIDYSEVGENSYEKQMTVYISDLPKPNASIDPYGMTTLKMFAGKKGEIIDVYGNSNHPEASFFDAGKTGFNWAFVAAGNEKTNIGVAEVGLPASNLNTSDRKTILKDNSIKNVFTAVILEAYPTATPELIAPYLKNTEAPGYFSNSGFLAAGTSPASDYDILETSIEKLSPYNPVEISNLKVEFKKLETAK